jgi:hypothetical protein
MKRKHYKEESPEPKDYRGSDFSVDCSRSSWAAAGRDDNDLFYWEDVDVKSAPHAKHTASQKKLA